MPGDTIEKFKGGMLTCSMRTHGFKFVRARPEEFLWTSIHVLKKQDSWKISADLSLGLSSEEQRFSSISDLSLRSLVRDESKCEGVCTFLECQGVRS
jgi:hypothetical protein